MLENIEIFVEVAKQQSFSGGAKSLGLTNSMASKHIAGLEETLGVKLFNRTTRVVELTAEGAAFYERAQRAVDDLHEAATHIQDMKTGPKGRLRISIPLSFAHMHLLPVITAFAKKYPDITLDVSLDDRTVDVIGEGFDMVIRIGAMADSSLTCRHLADCPVFPVASPDYIRRHSVPKSPAELKRHRMIVYSYQGGAGEWRYRNREGKTGSVRSEGIFRANTAEMMLQAAMDGVGIAVLPMFCVKRALQTHQLLRMLPGHETYPLRQISALMPPSRYRSAKVKLLVDWIAQSCKDLHDNIA